MEKQNREGSGCSYQDQDREEQKMEEFFALIRRFHEAKNRRKEELLLMEQEERTRKTQYTKKIKRVNEERPSSAWAPTFQREDFTKEIEFRKTPMVFSEPCHNYNNRDGRKRHLEQEEEEEEEELEGEEGENGHDRGLDLKLAL